MRAVPRKLLSTFVLGLTLAAVGAASASAHQVSPYAHSGSFDGSGSDIGPMTAPAAIAINESTGNVYIGEPRSSCVYITQFDSTGLPQAWTGREGESSFCAGAEPLGAYPALAYDNSGHGGGLYFEGQHIYAYNPDGTERAPFPLTGETPTGGDVAVGPDGTLWASEFYGGTKKISREGDIAFGGYFWNGGAYRLAVDAEEHFYLIHPNGGPAEKDGPEFTYEEGGLFGGKVAYGQYELTLTYNAPRDVAVDTSTGHVFVLEEGGGKVTEYLPDGSPAESFGMPEAGFTGLVGAIALEVNSATHDVYVVNAGASPPQVEIFHPGAPKTVPDTTTGGADPQPTAATLHGVLNPDGLPTTDCRFEWGSGPSLYDGGSVDCAEGTVHAGTEDLQVSAQLTGLTTGTTYHYRLAAKNAEGIYSYGADHSFQASSPPSIDEPLVVEDVNTDSARVTTGLDPNGGSTSYWIEYGAEDCAASTCARSPVPSAKLKSNLGHQQISTLVSGLAPATRYHFRLAAQNGAGTTTTADQTFTTFGKSVSEPCGNAQERQQTGASLLLDCRAYELVSARNAGGYDVESNSVPGQEPLPAHPDAENRLLYSLHSGAIPGIAGSPTNYGREPYVATRGENGWTTSYVGIPATAGDGASLPFGSPLRGADDGLATFAFAGPGLCDPCFPDGSSGIPVRLPDGTLVQGMAGDLDPGPEAQPAGTVRKMVSADGNHLVFGSTAKFEPDANGNGDPTIYERDLRAGTTEVVSKDAGGATLTGPGTAELDVSGDGSRVVVGDRIGSDGAGNPYYHLYMHLTGSAASADLSPGAANGVLFDGMTADGSKVFFTSPDSLVGSDTDNSSDIYEADVSADGSVQIGLISTGGGGTGNTDSCSPGGSPAWNGGGCDVLAFAGGGGLASGDGTFYFLSPELLDGPGNGSAGEPNLYAVAPGGTPQFVATLEEENPAVQHATEQSEVRDTADFQITPDGSFAAFAATRPLTGFINRGHSEIYRYDTAAAQLICISCAPTNAAATEDTYLTSNGLNLIDDGRVFFTSDEGLVLRDTNRLADAYEWEQGKVQLISTGSSTTDATLLSASADGTDAFFFTRQKLVPQDENGNAVKVYDARAGGGFLFIPDLQPCAASDECHGAGTPAPPQPAINTVTGQGGEHARGVAKKKPRHRHRHHKRRHHKKHRKHNRGGHRG